MMNKCKRLEIVTFARTNNLNELIVVVFNDVLSKIKDKGLGYGRYQFELMSLVVQELSLCFLLIKSIELSSADCISCSYQRPK
jgi:hypothetical protein